MNTSVLRQTSDCTLHASKSRKRSRKAIFLTWLRLTHLYVGLWGAALGLLFGITGILLNHRAILKIPVEKTVQTTAQLPIPAHGFSKPDELSAWLQSELGFVPKQTPIIRAQPAGKVLWGGNEVMQPERWNVSLHSPQRGVNAEYFVGNKFVRLDHIDATPVGTLTRLHMAVGVNAFWVLLSDTIAGGLIVLSITGLLLWTQLHRARTIGVLLSVAALLGGMWFMWSV